MADLSIASFIKFSSAVVDDSNELINDIKNDNPKYSFSVNDVTKNMNRIMKLSSSIKDSTDDNEIIDGLNEMEMYIDDLMVFINDMSCDLSNKNDVLAKAFYFLVNVQRNHNTIINDIVNYVALDIKKD